MCALSLGSGGRITGWDGERARPYSDRCTRRELHPHQSTPGPQVRNHLPRHRHTQERGQQEFMAKEFFYKRKTQKSSIGLPDIPPAPGSQNSIIFQIRCIASSTKNSSSRFPCLSHPHASSKVEVSFSGSSFSLYHEVVTWASDLASTGISFPMRNVDMGTITGSKMVKHVLGLYPP